MSVLRNIDESHILEPLASHSVQRCDAERALVELGALGNLFKTVFSNIFVTFYKIMTAALGLDFCIRQSVILISNMTFCNTTYLQRESNSLLSADFTAK